MRNQRLDNLVEKSRRHYRVEAVKRQIYAVVADTILREVIGADTPRAVARADLAFALAGFFGQALFFLYLVKARF